MGHTQIIIATIIILFISLSLESGGVANGQESLPEVRLTLKLNNLQSHLPSASACSL